jgi:hypothetical protein
MGGKMPLYLLIRLSPREVVGRRPGGDHVGRVAGNACAEREFRPLFGLVFVGVSPVVGLRFP